MEDIRVARATSNDAFAVAALHLQHDIGGGAAPEPGFLDRFVDWWLERREVWPAWLATTPTGNPVGLVCGRLVDVRPAPGQAPGTRLEVETLFVPAPWRERGIGSRLVVEVQSWGRTRGLRSVVFPTTDACATFLDRRGFAVPGTGRAEWRPGVRAEARA